MLALLPGLLAVMPAFAQPQPGDAAEWMDYGPSLLRMNVPEVHALGHTGAGTAIAHLEDRALRWGAVQAETGEPLFGNCTRPPGAVDSLGWQPEGEGCRIAWVMCFAVGPGGGRTDCQVETGNHATQTAKGLVEVAPDTRIIALQLRNLHGRAYANAAEWLLTPGDATAWYLANGYTQEEADYYRRVFGGQSPAARWNVVATSGSFLFPIRAGIETAAAGQVRAIFAAHCEVQNPGLPLSDPLRYVDDWVAAHAGHPQLTNARNLARNVMDYPVASRWLQAAGIMPFFAAGNGLWQRQDPATGSREILFKTHNGLGFPACLADVFAVSGIAADYPQLTNRWHYIGSNAHPELTAVLTPAAASSHATPLAAAAVAVLRSPTVRPEATIGELLQLLRLSDNPPAYAGISCDPDRRGDATVFPAGAAGLGWNEPAELDCGPVSSPYRPPYSLPVLDLLAAVRSATGGECVEGQGC